MTQPRDLLDNLGDSLGGLHASLYVRLDASLVASLHANLRDSLHASLDDSLHANLCDSLADNLDAMKGLAMKVGQMVSYLDGSLPPDAQRVLRRLQQGGEPLDFEITPANRLDWLATPNVPGS